ncbi:hypothetical protein CEXT_223801 [Caerostris extrusa]|uniref:Uncharacterized protein n=1 Tax=Caerostris extrusa TaxID=172846 RepID=A0AAV4XW17_CAEEX|nr:hypothetical protein CEXT_223801 [Caerostris extrusa]
MATGSTHLTQLPNLVRPSPEHLAHGLVFSASEQNDSSLGVVQEHGPSAHPFCCFRAFGCSIEPCGPVLDLEFGM